MDFGESEQFVDHCGVERRLGERGDDRDAVDVGRHRLGSAAGGPALERKRSWLPPVDDDALVVHRDGLHHVSRDERDALLLLANRSEMELVGAFEGEPYRISSDADDAGRPGDGGVTHGSQRATCKDAVRPRSLRKACLERLASIRFDRVLAQGERAAAVRALDSCGVKPTSWAVARCGRSYAIVGLASGSDLAALGEKLGARVDEPPLVILDVLPRDPERIPALLQALAGPGRPAGVVDAKASGDSVTVELNEGATSLRLLVDVVDAELERILPLFPLGDATITAFAASTMRAPEIEASRLVETYTEPLLQGAEG